MEKMSRVNIIKADLSVDEHCKAIVDLTDHYAREPMGMEKSLPKDVKESLIQKLRDFPCSLHFLAFVGGRPAGLANCVIGFSTFCASSVLNVHDLAVAREFRGEGVGGALLEAVEKEAESKGYCKITLEVREDNRAKNLYERRGFSSGNPRMFFMEKKLK